MIHPTFDEDGYPTDETLKVIREWSHKDGYINLMLYVHEAWHWDDYFSREQKGEILECCAHTGGWSGNESIIGALEDNRLFWVMCWLESRRGGHYVFEVKDLHLKLCNLPVIVISPENDVK